MKSIEKTSRNSGVIVAVGRIPNPFESRSLLIALPGGGTLDLKNPAGSLEAEDWDSLYYPLFHQEPKRFLKKETYLRVHENLMAAMRVQLRLKNRRGIEKTGKKLHRLRRRYRARFAA